MTEQGMAEHSAFKGVPVFPAQGVPEQKAEEAKQLEAELEQRYRRTPGLHTDVVFEFTRDPAYLQQYYAMRARIYTEKWQLEHFPTEPDEFDQRGMILIARKGRQVVAGIRMLIRTPRSTKPLQIEADGIDLQNALPELHLDRVSYCELSRFARLPDYRGGDFAIQINRALKRKAIAHGVKYGFMLAPVSQTRSYRVINRHEGEEYVICDQVPIPDHEDFEGIRMMLSYFVYPEHFEGPDEYGVLHTVEEEAAV